MSFQNRLSRLPRLNPAPALPIVLIGLHLLLPNESWVLKLRGYGFLDAELAHARANGYYEGLIADTDPETDIEDTTPPLGWRPFAESGLVVVTDDYQRWRLVPDREVVWNGAVVRTNGLGFRSPPVATIKPPGTFRVVVLGSSNTMGHGVADGDLYTLHLQRWLDEASGPSRKVEVVNLAVSGDSPTQRLYRLLHVVPSLDADWILCDATALDPSLEELHLRWAVERGVSVPLDFVGRALAEAGVRPDDPAPVFHKKLSPHFRPLAERTYAGWAAESRRLGVPFSVVILPRADSKTESPRLFRMIRDLASEHGLDAIDLSSIFDDLPLKSYRVAPWDQHPNALGHRLIFEALRDELSRREEFLERLMEG